MLWLEVFQYVLGIGSLEPMLTQIYRGSTQPLFGTARSQQETGAREIEKSVITKKEKCIAQKITHLYFP